MARELMRVGMLTAHLSAEAGGVWEVVRLLTANLLRAGVHTSTFGLAPRRGAESPCGFTGHSGQGFRVRGPTSFGYAPGLSAALGGAYLDVTHCHGLWMYPSFVGYRWSRRTGRPHLITPHGMLDDWALRQSCWKKRVVGCWFEDRHLQSATCLHALCQTELSSLRGLGLRNPVALIPNGVDLPVRGAGGPAPWSGRVESGRRVLLFLGRLHRKKNVESLLLAFRALRRDCPLAGNWVLVIAGWGDPVYTKKIHALAGALEFGTAVVFLGPVYHEAKHAALTYADAFVLPSLSEGLPMAVLEAWSYGLPVLMTAGCNLVEGFSRGAALCIQDRPAGLAAGLERMVRMSADARRDMGIRGRQLVLERFLWPRVADQFAELYRWLVDGGARPDTIRLP